MKDSLAQKSRNILKICLIHGLSYFERTNTRETNETGGDWALLRFWPKSSPFGLFSGWWLGGKGGSSEKCNLSSFHQVITTCHPPQAFIEARRTIRTAFYFSISKNFFKKSNTTMSCFLKPLPSDATYHLYSLHTKLFLMDYEKENSISFAKSSSC